VHGRDEKWIEKQQIVVLRECVFSCCVAVIRTAERITEKVDSSSPMGEKESKLIDFVMMGQRTRMCCE
jgi:hypothetical protein